jgi:hypothetical protein
MIEINWLPASLALAGRRLPPHPQGIGKKAAIFGKTTLLLDFLPKS